MNEPYRSAQEARTGKTLQEQMREEIFRMRGKRAFLFQAAADRLDLLEAVTRTCCNKDQAPRPEGATQDAKDAARYRFLRMNIYAITFNGGSKGTYHAGGTGKHPDWLDSGVDQAIIDTQLPQGQR